MRKYRILFFFTALIAAWIWFMRFNKVAIEQFGSSGAVKITINFHVSIKDENIDDKIRIISERPGTQFIKSHSWINSKTLEIFVAEKGLPKGFCTKVSLGPLKTAIPGLYKTANVNFRADITPFLIDFSPVVPAKGPITLAFSTPIDLQKMKKYLSADFDYTLTHGHLVGDNGEIFKDFSKVILVPTQPLISGKDYNLLFEGPLYNLMGNVEKVGFHKSFKAAEKPRVVATTPTNGQEDIKLYENIIVNFDEEMQEVDIKVEDMIGDLKVEGKTAIFKPNTVYMPGRKYRVKVTGKSSFHEQMEPYFFEFTTVDMNDKWWVEVNLRPIQKLTVYRGNKVVKSMIASGGLSNSDTKTPTGFFKLQDRGEYFWSEKYQEGALYWVRITGNYLVHSVPRDKDNKIIKQEFIKLGIPASHGCIRLKDEDAKWFYETVPEGTPVIIHD